MYYVGPIHRATGHGLSGCILNLHSLRNMDVSTFYRAI